MSKKVSLKGAGRAIVTVAGFMALGIFLAALYNVAKIDEDEVNGLVEKIDNWLKPHHG